MQLNIYFWQGKTVYRLKSKKLRKTLVLIPGHPVYPSCNAAKK